MAIRKKKTKKKTTRKRTDLKKSGVKAKTSGKDTPDRCDWIHNQAIIEQAYFEINRETGRVPTATAIAERTGLRRETVGAHLKKFDFSRVRRRLGVALNIALGRAIENAGKPNAFFKDIELLYKIGGELVEKVEHGGRIDFRSLKEKLSDGSEGGDTDFERAKKLSQILISENLI